MTGKTVVCGCRFELDKNHQFAQSYEGNIYDQFCGHT